MPTAKSRYDSGGEWKYRHYDEAEWEELKNKLRVKLRGFYPDKSAEDGDVGADTEAQAGFDSVQANPTFGHPADAWVNSLLAEAEGAVSMMLWLRLRLTNEELRAERQDLLNTLNKADKCLSTLSHDLDIMLGVDADVLGCRDKIRELVPRIEAAEAAISRLPRARKLSDAQHQAAVEMAIRVLRILKDYNISTAATADVNFGYISDAVRILKIIGDELGLVLEPLTWRGIIIKAKQSAHDIT